METEQAAGSCPAPGQTPVRTWLPSSTRGAPKMPWDAVSRFHGDGVRYKAKLIGVDPVPDAQGDKMCWDSMMKLKGLEAVARRQGKHKQRLWLKISSTGVKMVDERTGAPLYDHERSSISCLTKDESDPRALAYVYPHEDTYRLFYIRMANLADPVLADIREVCHSVDPEPPQKPAEALEQTSSLLQLSESSAAPPQEMAFESVSSPRPDASFHQTSSGNELTDIFSFQPQEPLTPSESSCAAAQPESPQMKLSSSQILSMFPVQPAGASPYATPPYSPTAPPWGLPGPLTNQWASPAAVALRPAMPGNVPVTAPPVGGHMQAHFAHPGLMWGGHTPSSPPAVNGFHAPVSPIYAPTEAIATQPASPSFDHNLLL